MKVLLIEAYCHVKNKDYFNSIFIIFNPKETQKLTELK